MNWANSSSLPLLDSRCSFNTCFSRPIELLIQHRATLWDLMCCSCSPRWMEPENFWTSCSTTLRCPPVIHSPGKDSDFHQRVLCWYKFCRPWIQLQPLDRANPTALFTVMCYNVLCDRYTVLCLPLTPDHSLYFHPDMQRGACMATVLNGHSIGSTGKYWLSEELDSDHTIIFNRKKGILDEVRHYAADIIAMQEVSLKFKCAPTWPEFRWKLTSFTSSSYLNWSVMGRYSTFLWPFLNFSPSSGMMGFSLRNREPKQCQKATENTWMAVPFSTGTYPWMLRSCIALTSLAGFQDIKVCAGERTIGGVQPVGDRTCQRPRGHAQQVKIKLHAWQW